MVELPKKKVGIVACSGEEIPEGTVTRLAALKVLEQLRPAETVTICLPLFLAGGEGDRAFARFYPTLTLDGCDLRCAARATERYSSPPAASLVVSEIAAELALGEITGRRRLNPAGGAAVEAVAQRTVELVDELLGSPWDRRAGTLITPIQDIRVMGEAPDIAPCSCGSGIPVQRVQVGDEMVSFLALPLIFEQLHQSGKLPGKEISQELIETVRIYTPIPVGSEACYTEALLREYATFCARAA